MVFQIQSTKLCVTALHNNDLPADCQKVTGVKIAPGVWKYVPMFDRSANTIPEIVTATIVPKRITPRATL
jgi:hypothetical protein